MYVDSVISCILFSTKCKSGLAGEKLSGKTHDVGAGREKKAGKPVGRETGMLIMLLVYL